LLVADGLVVKAGRARVHEAEAHGLELSFAHAEPRVQLYQAVAAASGGD